MVAAMISAAPNWSRNPGAVKREKSKEVPTKEVEH